MAQPSILVILSFLASLGFLLLFANSSNKTSRFVAVSKTLLAPIFLAFIIYALYYKKYFGAVILVMAFQLSLFWTLDGIGQLRFIKSNTYRK